MIMRQNYFLDLLAVDSPSASSSGNTSSTIFSHSSAEVHPAQCPSQASWRPRIKIIGFSERSKPIINYFHKRCAWGLRNGSYVMSWDSQFAEPIVLPNNVVATTLRSREWQNARIHILQAADQVGSIWFARIAIIRALKRRMPRFRRRSWSPEELRLLDKLVVDGASPRTAAEALNRSKETVRTKARRVGCPFPHRDEVKRQRPLTQEDVDLPQLAR